MELGIKHTEGGGGGIQTSIQRTQPGRREGEGGQSFVQNYCLRVQKMYKTSPPNSWRQKYKSGHYSILSLGLERLCTREQNRGQLLGKPGTLCRFSSHVAIENKLNQWKG